MGCKAEESTCVQALHKCRSVYMSVQAFHKCRSVYMCVQALHKCSATAVTHMLFLTALYLGSIFF